MHCKYLTAAAAALLALSTAASASVSISFSGGSSGASGPPGNIAAFSTGGVSVQASAWSFSGKTLQSAWLARGSSGLAVTNNSEAAWGTPGVPMVDNLSQADFILLVFDRPVSIQSAALTPLQIGSFQSANDARVGYATIAGAFTAPAPTPVPLNSPLWGALNADAYNVQGNASSTFLTSFNSAGLFGNAWMIGAASGNYYDAFQLSSITVNSNAVPEPRTWGMMLIGFALIGAAFRTRLHTQRPFAQLA